MSQAWRLWRLATLRRSEPLSAVTKAVHALGARVARFVPPQPGTLRAGVVLQRIAALPVGDLAEVTGGHPVLILAPHPDDESLGCGGLIAEACWRGAPPVVAVLTDGSASHPGSRAYPPFRLRELRRQETLAAADALGLPVGRVHFLDLPDGAAPREGVAMEAAAARLAELARAKDAGAILASWEHDPHPDHLAAHVIARRAAQLAGARLVSYLVWGWALPPAAWLPATRISGLRLDIATHLPVKRRAIAAHASQHGRAVTDDPAGFRLPASLLSAVDQPFECYLFDR